MASETIENLIREFRLWKTEVLRLATKVTGVQLSDTSDRINGYTFEELKQIIRREVNLHADDPNNPHKTDFSQFGGMSRANVENTLNGKILRVDFPVTKNTSDGFVSQQSGPLTIKVESGAVAIRGFTVPIAGMEIPVQENVPKQYLKLQMVRTQQTNYVKTAFAIANHGPNKFETDMSVIVGVINMTEPGVYAMSLFNYIAFDNFRVSVTPAGKSIPASTGNNSGTGAIVNEWF